MIKQPTAQSMAKKFFREKGLANVVGQIESGACTDEVFASVVRSQGKLKTRELYLELPRRLKVFLTFELAGNNDQRLERKLVGLFEKLGEATKSSHHPERTKQWAEFEKASDEILLHYFET